MPIERTSDLAPHAQLELGWRLAAACSAAAFEPDEPTRAERHGWFYDDGGGTSARMILVDGGRAVLLGWDRDFTRTTDEGIDVLETAPVGCVAPRAWPLSRSPGSDSLPGSRAAGGARTSTLPSTAWRVGRGTPRSARRRDAVNSSMTSSTVPQWTILRMTTPVRKRGRTTRRLPASSIRVTSPSREALLAMMVFEECDLDAAAAAIRAFGDVTPVSLDEEAPTSQD